MCPDNLPGHVVPETFPVVGVVDLVGGVLLINIGDHSFASFVGGRPVNLDFVSDFMRHLAPLQNTSVNSIFRNNSDTTTSHTTHHTSLQLNHPYTVHTIIHNNSIITQFNKNYFIYSFYTDRYSTMYCIILLQVHLFLLCYACFILFTCTLCMVLYYIYFQKHNKESSSVDLNVNEVNLFLLNKFWNLLLLLLLQNNIRLLNFSGVTIRVTQHEAT